MKTTNNSTNAQDKTYTILDLYNNKDKIYVTEDLVGNKHLCKLTDKGFYSKLIGNKEEAKWKGDYFTLNGILGLKFKEVPKFNLYRVKIGTKLTIDCINLKDEEIEVGDLVVVTNSIFLQEGYGIVEEVVTDYEDTCGDYYAECFLEPRYATTHKNKKESSAKEEAYKALTPSNYRKDRLSKIVEYLKKASHNCPTCSFRDEGTCKSLNNCAYDIFEDIMTLAKKLDLPIIDLLDCDEEQD